jgi:hypothetical protein
MQRPSEAARRLAGDSTQALRPCPPLPLALPPSVRALCSRPSSTAAAHSPRGPAQHLLARAKWAAVPAPVRLRLATGTGRSPVTCMCDAQTRACARACVRALQVCVVVVCALLGIAAVAASIWAAPMLREAWRESRAGIQIAPASPIKQPPKPEPELEPATKEPAEDPVEAERRRREAAAAAAAAAAATAEAERAAAAAVLTRRQEGEACSLAEDYEGAVAAFAGALALPDALRHAPELPDLLTAAEHMLEQQQAARAEQERAAEAAAAAEASLAEEAAAVARAAAVGALRQQGLEEQQGGHYHKAARRFHAALELPDALVRGRRLPACPWAGGAGRSGAFSPAPI